MHKKILLFIPIIILIISTAFTKNSTKKLDKQIFEIQEDIRALNDIHELVLFDYNYLTSPNKLMEYSKICLLYTSPSPRDVRSSSRMPSSA